VTWHFTFEMQITHSHCTVYVWRRHSTFSPHSIHLRCSYQTPTLQYTSEVQIPPSHLAGLSKVYLMAYIWGADTTLLPYSIYYMYRYHLLNLQYIYEVLIPPSHLTVYISYADMTLPPYHIYTYLSYRYLTATSQYTYDIQIPPSHSVRQSKCAKYLVIHNWWQCNSWGMSKPFWDFQPL
jgi:hypothetical protein